VTSGSASTPALERRRERRVPVHLPMLVRGRDSMGLIFEERTSSENVCRGGAAFSTRHSLADEPSEFSTQGRIVHLKPGKSADELIVGVEFTGPRFHRMFVSEST